MNFEKIQFYDADAWVCMAEGGSERRYDWIEYEDGTVLGDKKGGQCRSERRVVSQIGFF